jgi:hypothetical protein
MGLEQASTLLIDQISRLRSVRESDAATQDQQSRDKDTWCNVYTGQIRLQHAPRLSMHFANNQTLVVHDHRFPDILAHTRWTPSHTRTNMYRFATATTPQTIILSKP